MTYFLRVIVGMFCVLLSLPTSGKAQQSTGAKRKDLALLIAIQAYPGVPGRWHPLWTPIADADSLRQVLQRRYGFDSNSIRPVYNATKAEIIDAFDWLVKRVHKNDRVLVYYSGHGQLERLTDEGFWIPVDGVLPQDPKSPLPSESDTWFSNKELKLMLKKLQRATHILVIVDACFSGQLGRSRERGLREEQIHEWKEERELFEQSGPDSSIIRTYDSHKSRKVFASGLYDQKVPDTGGFGHSPFAHYLLEALNHNSVSTIPARALFSRVIENMEQEGGQVPIYSPIPGLKDAQGEFVFFTKPYFPPGNRDYYTEDVIVKSRLGWLLMGIGIVGAIALVIVAVCRKSVRAKPVAPFVRGSGRHEGMIWVPPGSFPMGNDQGRTVESPMHEVFVSGFYIDQYPVTNAEFRRFLIETRYLPAPEHWKYYDFPDGLEDHPVTGIDLRAILAYCEWAGKRLPTEAEWEKAASWDADVVRKLIYPWGNTFLPERCNSIEQGMGGTISVHAFPKGSSPYGVMDMAGNVWEMCWDYYDPDFYKKSPQNDPTGPRVGRLCVFRGGAWDSEMTEVRCTNRRGELPDLRLRNHGFRCACDASD